MEPLSQATAFASDTLILACGVANEQHTERVFCIYISTGIFIVDLTGDGTFNTTIRTLVVGLQFAIACPVSVACDKSHGKAAASTTHTVNAAKRQEARICG